MSLVLDASVVLRIVLNSGRRASREEHVLHDRLSTEDWHAPELLDLEVASALRRLLAAREIGAKGAANALGLLREAPLQRYPHLPLLPRAWALRADLTTYDASYVALAGLLDATLLTSDGRLARASGPRCPVELVG